MATEKKRKITQNAIRQKSRIKGCYLDYASATPISERVIKEMKKNMKPGLVGLFQNPNSTHEIGIMAKSVLNDSRREISHILSVRSDEIIFTSGATEGNNLAINGIVNTSLAEIKKPKVITTSVEHSSILEPLRILKNGGIIDLVEIDPAESSLVDVQNLKANLDENTVLISISHANSETGDIVNVREIKRVIDKWKKERKIINSYPYIHVDSSQSSMYLDESPHNMGADIVVFDGAKMYSLRGVGLMYVKRGVKLEPLFRGGGQQKGIRPGTENVIGAIALKTSFHDAIKSREGEIKRLIALKTTFLQELKKNKVDFRVNFFNKKSLLVLPSILNVCIEGLNAEFAVIQLSQRGIHVSAGSACESSSGVGKSFVIEKIIGNGNCATSSLRISFGRYTKKSDIKRAAKEISNIIQTHK